MKTRIKILFLRPTLMAGFGLILGGQVTAQTFTNLYFFTTTSGYPSFINNDGAGPYAGLILSVNTLYGTTFTGGSSGNGTVFKINTDGTGFTNLYVFTATHYNNGYDTNSDGANPEAGLILSDNTLYGTASAGGTSSFGTVFKVNTDGTCFTNLHSFTAIHYVNTLYTNTDGADPHAGLILSGNTLYGTAGGGGTSGRGTVFAINTDGTGFTNLHNFTGVSDGAVPFAGLILSSNTLYGTARSGGSAGLGTVFALCTNGTGFTNLYNFTSTGSNGYYPYGILVLAGNALYGTAYSGGSSDNGTVYKVNTDGMGFTTLHGFTGGSDGAYPYAGLILSDHTLYGTAEGGSSGSGTVFAVNTNGTGFTTLHSFATIPASGPYTNSDGAFPDAGLILSGNTLYGTTRGGGRPGSGTVFSLFIPPQLTIILSGANVILSWPTNADGFTLQFTTNLVSPAVWRTVSPGPDIVNGQNTVTNPISGTLQFYRLSQ